MLGSPADCLRSLDPHVRADCHIHVQVVPWSFTNARKKLIHVVGVCFSGTRSAILYEIGGRPRSQVGQSESQRSERSSEVQKSEVTPLKGKPLRFSEAEPLRFDLPEHPRVNANRITMARRQKVRYS